MGLGDIVSKVLTVYKADVSDHKAAIKGLAGEEKKAAQDRLSDLDRHNKGIESQIRTLGKYTLALGAIGVAGKVAFDSIEFAGRRADLTAASAGVSIDRLRKATLGLKTDMELLEFAAKVNHGTMKLNADQIDVAAKAMVALEERGGKGKEAVEALTDALVTGRTRGLKDFGIDIDETKDKTAKLTAIMAELSKITGEVGEETLDGADKFKKAQVEMTNAIDQIRVGIGELATSLTPLISGLAKVASTAADIFNATRDGWEGIRGAFKGDQAAWDKFWGADREHYSYNGQQEYAATGDRYANWLAGKNNSATWVNQHFGEIRGTDSQAGIGLWESTGARELGGDAIEAENARRRAELGLPPVAPTKKRSSGGGGRRATPAAASDPLTDGTWSPFGSLVGLGRGLGETAGRYADAARGEQAGQAADQARAIAESAANFDRFKMGVSEMQRELLETQEAKRQSLLESVFGTQTDFDATRTALESVRDSWSGLSNAVAAGFDAMVDGSQSFGAAFKQSIVGSLKAHGHELTLLALKETGLGIASLALGPIGGVSATAHFKAAAVFGAGAALAGVSASALGSSSGSGASGGGSRALPSNSAGSGSGTPERTTVIVYADQFADNSPRMKQQQAERVVQRALGTTAVEHS